MEVGTNLKGCIRQRKNLSRRKGTPVLNVSSIWFHVKSPYYMSSFNSSASSGSGGGLTQKAVCMPCMWEVQV